MGPLTYTDGASVRCFCKPARGAPPITWENSPRTRLHRRIGLTRPVWPGCARAPFFPLWLPSPCFQKSRASVLPAPNDRHGKSPTATASQESRVASRRTNSRTGQILGSCVVDGDCRLIFKLAAISDRWMLVRPSGTSLGTSEPSANLRGVTRGQIFGQGDLLPLNALVFG